MARRRGQKVERTPSAFLLGGPTYVQAAGRKPGGLTVLVETQQRAGALGYCSAAGVRAETEPAVESPSTPMASLTRGMMSRLESAYIRAGRS